MTVVEDAERQVLAVVDVEHEQLLLGNFADEINVRALVVQVNIDAVHGQTNAVAVYGVYDLERLTHAVDAPLLVADRLEGQLDTVRLGNVGEFVQHLHRVVENLFLVPGADLIGDSRHHDDIRIADLLRHLAAEGEQLYELFPLLRRAEVDVFNGVECKRLDMALCKKSLEIVHGVGLEILLQHIKTQLDIVIAVLFAQQQVVFNRGIFLAGCFVISEFQHKTVSFTFHRALHAR